MSSYTSIPIHCEQRFFNEKVRICSLILPYFLVSLQYNFLYLFFILVKQRNVVYISASFYILFYKILSFKETCTVHNDLDETLHVLPTRIIHFYDTFYYMKLSPPLDNVRFNWRVINKRPSFKNFNFITLINVFSKKLKKEKNVNKAKKIYMCV